MSRFGLRPSSCAAMLFIAASLGAQEQMMMPASARSQELLKRYDKNGDGKIDDDERADAQEVIMKERIEKQVAQARVLPGGLEELRLRALERFDKNKDGMLDEEERAAALKFADERLAAGGTEGADLLRRLDRNNDGKVDEAERNAFKTMLAEARPLVTPAPAARGVLVSNGERIDFTQMQETEKVLRAAIEADAAQRARFDKNTNGKLEDEEWQSARRQIGLWMGIAAGGGSGLSPEAEQRRLEAVAEEVARRRKIRDEAQAQLAPGAEKRTASAATLEAEQKRLETVSEEVAKRRKLREEAQSLVNGTPATPKQSK